MRWIAAIVMLAGCEKLLGLSEITPDAPSTRVTGDYHYLLAGVAGDLSPVMTEVAPPADTELIALLPDGTPLAVDRADDGSFSFELPVGASYRFVARDSDMSIWTELQSSSPTIALRRNFYSRSDAKLAGESTVVTVDQQTPGGWSGVTTIGVRSNLLFAPAPGTYSFNWSGLALGLLSAAKNDRLVSTHWTTSTTTPLYYFIDRATLAPVEMTDGQPTAVTGALLPISADRCVHLITHGKTELARLSAVTGVTVDVNSVTSWDFFSTPFAAMGFGGTLPLAQNSSNIPMDVELDVAYGSPYVGEADLSLVQVGVETLYGVPQAAGVELEDVEQLWDLIPPSSGGSCSASIDSDASPIALLATSSLAGVQLQKDAQSISIDRSQPVPFDYTLTSGAVDNISVELDEVLAVDIGTNPTSIVVPVRVFVVRDTAAIDPALFTRGHYYVFRVITQRGLPGAPQLDYRTHSFPAGTATIYTSMFRIAN